MSKESLEKHFPPGSPISLKDVEGDCRYKLEVVEFVGNGVVGTNDKGEKIFVPWRYGLVMSEQGECDCINCNPDECDSQDVYDFSSYVGSGQSVMLDLDLKDGERSVVESMLWDLAGAPSADLNESEDGIPPIAESRWGNAKRYR